MAEVVTRLVVESQEYDAKIKRAAEGLLHLEEHVRKLGGNLEVAEKEDLEFVQALGQMETASRSAAGRVTELTTAFTDLSAQYKRLTSWEKQGEYGQALSKSLSELKTRVGDAKTELKDIQSELTGSNSLMEIFAEKVGVPSQLLTKLGLATAGVTAALKVMKDAFFDTEQGIDDWGRALEIGKGAYTSFLDTLNNGNWSDFFANLFKAVGGARDLYNAMDRLKSIKGNNAAAIAETQALIQELRLRQQRGENVTKELKAAQSLLEQLQKQAVVAGKAAGEKQMTTTIRSSVNSMEGAPVSQEDITTAVKEIIHSGQEAFDKYKELAETLEKKGSSNKIIGFDESGRELHADVFDIKNLSVDDQSLYKLAKSITQKETTIQEGIAIYAQAAQSETASNSAGLRTQRSVNKGEKEAAKLTPEEKTQQKAEEKVTKALEEYAETITVATIRKDAGLDDEEKYRTKELSAHENLLDAYTEAYNATSDPKYKEALDKEAAAILEYAQSLKELKDANEQQKQANRELKRAQEEAVRQAQRVDMRTLSGLRGAAKRAGMSASDLGLDKLEQEIKVSKIDIDDTVWQHLQDVINERLQKLGLNPIRIDFETGNLEEVVDTVQSEMERLTDNLGQGVSAVSTLGNAFDDLKNIGEDLASAFSGEMDAWDALMTVFNSGIGIMQTVIGVMEAINTLQELGNALSDVRTAKAGTEAAAVSAANTSEATTEMEKADASMVSAGANAAEGATAAGKSVSWIPIVGPALAFAAITGTIAAMVLAMNKAKHAGNYAEGGIVPGASFTGDRLVAGVNSGELILTMAQQDRIASILTAGNPMSNLRLSTEVSGANLRIVLDNDNRSRGGSRGYYANVH